MSSGGGAADSPSGSPKTGGRTDSMKQWEAENKVWLFTSTAEYPFIVYSEDKIK